MSRFWNKKNMKSQEGQTLVEIIVACGLIAFALASIIGIAMASKNILYLSQDNTKATTLAQEGIEIARHQRDIDCPFSQIALQVTGGTHDFVIRSDTVTAVSDPVGNQDESVIPGSGNGILIDNYPGFSRQITIYDMGDSSFPYNQIISNSNFSSGSGDYDTTDQYYYITVSVTWSDSSGHPQEVVVSNIISKQ